MSAYKRPARLLAATFFVYALLVATHLGEFWPFSIYPMFSQGGIPWSRAVVREVPPEGPIDWQPVSQAELPGEPFALQPNGIDPIDLANYVSKSRTWNRDRVQGLQTMFADRLEDRQLLVMRAQGHLDEHDSVRVAFTPYILLRPDTALINPTLPR